MILKHYFKLIKSLNIFFKWNTLILSKLKNISKIQFFMYNRIPYYLTNKTSLFSKLRDYVGRYSLFYTTTYILGCVE